jgi:hypothetical protein
MTARVTVTAGRDVGHVQRQPGQQQDVYTPARQDSQEIRHRRLPS